MADIMTQVNRINEMSELLLEMFKEFYNTKRYRELSDRFDDLVAINRLEDEINGEET